MANTARTAIAFVLACAAIAAVTMAYAYVVTSNILLGYAVPAGITITYLGYLGYKRYRKGGEYDEYQRG